MFRKVAILWITVASLAWLLQTSIHFLQHAFRVNYMYQHATMTSTWLCTCEFWWVKHHAVISKIQASGTHTWQVLRLCDNMNSLYCLRILLNSLKEWLHLKGLSYTVPATGNVKMKRVWTRLVAKLKRVCVHHTQVMVGTVEHSKHYFYYSHWEGYQQL